MNRSTLAAAFASVLALSAAPAFAQETETEEAVAVSGGVALVNKYGFSDLFVQTDSPTTQAWLSIPVGDTGCSVELFAAHGLETRVGREADIGGACAFGITETVEGRVSVSRYILGGATDITTLEGAVTSGPVDIGVTQYIVDGVEADATKFEIGYTVEPTDRLSIRAVGVYETGFGLPDIAVGGLEARYAYSENAAFTVNAYAPIHRGAGDPREAQVFLGFEWSF